MSSAENILGFRVIAEDDTKAVIDGVERNVNRAFKGIADVAGGILVREFARNVVGAFEDVAKSSVQQAAAFELATVRIIAASQATGAEAEELKETLEAAAFTLGMDYAVGATAAMEAMEALVKAGLEPGTEAVAALEGVLQLATIEQMNTAEASNLVVQAMTMFSLSAEEATRIVNGFAQASASGIDTAAGYAQGLSNVGATANAMGFSMEETLAALVQLDNTFGGATESGTFLNRMLLDLSRKAEDAGLSLYQAVPAAEEEYAAMMALQTATGDLTSQLKGQRNRLDELTESYQVGLNALEDYGDQIQGLTLDQSVNRLEIQKIRDAQQDRIDAVADEVAALLALREEQGKLSKIEKKRLEELREYTKLTDEEELAIRELESANRDLSIEVGTLRIQETEARIALEEQTEALDEAKASNDELEESLKATKEELDLATEAVESSSGQMLGMDEITAQLREKIQGFGDDQAALNEWLNLFDMRAQRAILGLTGYDETVAETQEDLGDMKTAQEQANEILDTTTGKLNKVKAIQEEHNIAIGDTTTALAVQSAEMTSSLGPIGNLASSLGPNMLSGAMQGLTIMAIPKLIGAITGAGGLSGAFTGLTSAGGAIPSLLGAIGAGGPILLAIAGVAAAVLIFKAAWDGNWGGIRDRVADAATAIGNIIDGIGSALSDAWSNVTDWASDVVTAAENAWNKAVDWLTKKKPRKKTKTTTPEEPLDGEPLDVETTTTTTTTVPTEPAVDVPREQPTTAPGEAVTTTKVITRRRRRRRRKRARYTPLAGDVPLQHGFEGVVSQPTRFIVGEAGPEYLRVTPGATPRPSTVNVGVTFVIEGEFTEETYQRIRPRLKEELQNVIIEATSDGAPTSRILFKR